MTDVSFSGGRYLVERVLGKGGQKIVYLVQDVRLERPCALALLGDVVGTEDSARLDNEARSLAHAGAHPNVVTVFDIGEENGRPFIVSEYVPGGDLADELKRSGGKLALPRTMALARDLLRALSHVHQCGIVHRDLKPSNVWITADGAPKLGDFGLALRADHRRFTEAGGIVGTPSYLAPEQISARDIDGRTDLYALGCLLFELLSGRPPFIGPLPSVIAQHLHATPPPLEDLPPDIDTFLRRLLAKSPDRRPSSAADALSELEHALTNHSSVRTAMPSVQPHDSGPNKPAIAVLPFKSSSDDAYFSEGLAEDTIISLSKFSSLFVIARSSSFRYRSEDLPRIRSELGVSYVVDGRVRRTPDRILISIELIRAEDGRNLWAERYDRPLSEIFRVQDEVTRTIVATLVNRVEAARLEDVRRAPTDSLAAYDCVLRGKDHHHRYSLEDNQRAQEMFERAMELDPHYAVAHAWLACAFGQCMVITNGAANISMERFFDLVSKAHALDPNESECHRLFAAVYTVLGRFDEALAHQERALALNPNDDRIVCQMGELLTYLGRAEEGLSWIRLALRLNPFRMDATRSDLGRALYCTGRWAEALEALQGIGSPRPAHVATVASCHLRLGDRASAERSCAALLAMSPQLELEAFLRSLRFKRREDLAGLEHDLRALGLA